MLIVLFLNYLNWWIKFGLHNIKKGYFLFMGYAYHYMDIRCTFIEYFFYFSSSVNTMIHMLFKNILLLSSFWKVYFSVILCCFSSKCVEISLLQVYFLEKYSSYTARNVSQWRNDKAIVFLYLPGNRYFFVVRF